MSSPYKQLDKRARQAAQRSLQHLVRDVAEVAGKYATLKIRVEALEARQMSLVAQASVNMLELMRRHKELIAMHVELGKRHNDLCSIVAGLDARLTAACEPNLPELPGRRSSRAH